MCLRTEDFESSASAISPPRHPGGPLHLYETFSTPATVARGLLPLLSVSIFDVLIRDVLAIARRYRTYPENSCLNWKLPSR